MTPEDLKRRRLAVQAAYEHVKGQRPDIYNEVVALGTMTHMRTSLAEGALVEENVMRLVSALLKERQ